jgi:hypothetical protein
MLIQLVGIKSTNPDFAAPKARNGEDMELFSVEATGQYMVARYFSTETVAGPAVERYFTDLYCNGEGREVYRVTAKIVEPPPPPPTFRAKLRAALQTLFA